MGRRFPHLTQSLPPPPYHIVFPLNRFISAFVSTEAAEIGGRPAGGGEGGPDQGVGDQQAERARSSKPAPQGAKPSLQSAARAAKEAHGRHSR